MKRWIANSLLAAGVAAFVSVPLTMAMPRIFPTAFASTTPPDRPLTPPPAPGGKGSSAHAKPASVAALPAASEKEKSPWWATLLGSIAWPLALLLALGMIAVNSTLRRIFGAGSRLVRKISAGGVEMEISSEAVDSVRQHLKGSFRELMIDAREEYERMADLQDIDRLLALVMKKEVLADLKHQPADIRATVHVRDIVFRDFLYQLVDYYPKGEGAHRRFSQRYGIIGRSWRSGVSHGTGNAFGDGASEDTLVEEWGMTREETHGVLHGRPSCLSVLLRAGEIETGILYIDSTNKNAFGVDDKAALDFALKLEKRPLVATLANAVERAMAPLRAAGPNIDIKELG